MVTATEKPHAPACDRNRQVILDVLNQVIQPQDKQLLEIGSGTGQHAVFMSAHFPNLIWQTSDLEENHTGIKLWLAEEKSPQLKSPVHYQAGKTIFPSGDFDVVYTANTLHIMSWENVQSLINDLGNHLKAGSRVVIYGPFNYNGQFTSESNAKFELWLKDQNPESGIRDFELVNALMLAHGFELLIDKTMPANNRCLVFSKC